MFSRYGNAETLLDGYINYGRLRYFINDFIDICNEEQVWDIWKHKVQDKSYSEFREEILTPDNQAVSAAKISETINQSLDILAKFNPYETGVSNNGTV